jgi:hypothetical protein
MICHRDTEAQREVVLLEAKDGVEWKQKLARLLHRINDLQDASAAWVEVLNGGE